MPRRNERGAALLIVLVAVGLVTAVAVALMVVTSTDTLIGGAYRTAHETFYAADAALDRALAELALMPSWTPALATPPGNLVASYDDGTAMITAPDGRSYSVAAMNAARQSASNAVYSTSAFGADTPSWRLFAHCRFRDLVPPGTVAPPAYLLVWVADDGGDGDGDATRDSNAQVLVHAEALGVGGSRRAIEAAVGRAAPGVIRLLAWKDVR
jgi:hypothetical protein